MTQYKHTKKRTDKPTIMTIATIITTTVKIIIIMLVIMPAIITMWV